MSAQHRPYAVITVDLFPAEGVRVTDEALARAAWDHVTDWVQNGYQPVVEVVTEDHSADVDLEDVP